MVLLLFKILRLEQKIVNQLSRRITNSLFSLECFILCKNSILKDYLMKRIEKERSLSLYP